MNVSLFKTHRESPPSAVSDRNPVCIPGDLNKTSMTGIVHRAKTLASVTPLLVISGDFVLTSL